MARIRTIKPEFFTSEDIVALSPMARLLYVATWCEADREGRLSWKPKTMKMRYFPADDCDIDALARELHASGLVTLYGDGLAYIPSFARHQHVNPREAQSSLPSPEKARVDDASARVSDAQVGRKEGKEGEGKEKNELPPSAAVDPISEMISGAVEFMGSRGVPEKQARSVVGMVRKAVGDDLVAAELLAIAAREGIADPVPWLRQAANKRKQVVSDAAPKPWDGAL